MDVKFLDHSIFQNLVKPIFGFLHNASSCLSEPISGSIICISRIDDGETRTRIHFDNWLFNYCL